MEPAVDFRVFKLAVEPGAGWVRRGEAVRIRLPQALAVALAVLGICIYRTRRPVSLGKELYSPGRLLVVHGRELAIETTPSVETEA